jgi:hypothetical protein
VWKLSGGKVTPTALSSGTNDAFAYALAAQGGDLYAAGMEFNGSTKTVAMVWKLSGGTVTPTALTGGTTHAVAYTILLAWE